MKHAPSILGSLNRVAREERYGMMSAFVAPVSQGEDAVARVKGVRCAFKVEPEGFDGWGVFLPVAPSRATLIRMATDAERLKYLRRLPSACLILCTWRHPRWDAVLADLSDRRFGSAATAPVYFTGTARRFDTVRARYDGERFLFESLHRKSDADLAALLRKTLEWQIDPRKLQCPQLTPALRRAYSIAYSSIARASRRSR